MTKKKHVAKTLKTINTNPITLDIINRNVTNLSSTIEEVQSWWGYDLFKRKPGPAYYDEENTLQLTDLDLICFLWELSKRNSIINIPEYKSRRVSKIRQDQKKISNKNRSGEIISLQSNQNFFSFSITIKDMNIVSEDSVGDFRTFLLTDFDGTWYNGWKSIQFTSTLKENKWIYENKLLTDNRIIFKNFISPNRWISFFGHHYFITKLMIERLTEESKYCRTSYKNMLKEGIKFPGDKGPESQQYGSKSPGIKKKFDAFEVKIQHPLFINEHVTLESNQKNMINLYEKQKKYSTILKGLRFMTRATEFAHFKHSDYFPGWLKNTKWEKDYVEKGKRIKWERLVLFQGNVGEIPWALLKRSYPKSTEVSI